MRRLTAATLLLALAFGALLAEGFARQFGFGHALLYRSGPAGYELAPNQIVWRGGAMTHINALGARGPNAEGLPSAGVFRVLVLGDSVANGGVLVNDADTWPQRLETALSKPGKPAEVLNASAGGWSVPNEAAWLREHGTLGAKLIVLEVNQMDLDQPFETAAILDANKSFPSRDPPFALYEIVDRYLLPRLHIGPKTSDPGSEGGAFRHQNVAPMLAAVEAIRAQAAAHGAQLVILYWDVRTRPGPEAVAATNQLMTYANGKGLRVVRPHLEGPDTASLYYRDPIHPNAYGNAQVAEILAPAIDR